MTKAIPNDAKLILFTDDTEGWSNETTSVRVPTCCPTVQAMRLDEERDTLERQRTPVDAAHSVASQDVTTVNVFGTETLMLPATSGRLPIAR